MPHFIHDRVGVILGERHHRRALAPFLAIRRDARVRSDLLPVGPKGHGVLLDAREELRLGSKVAVGDALLQRAPDVVERRGGRDLGGISDVEKLREGTRRKAQLRINK